LDDIKIIIIFSIERMVQFVSSTTHDTLTAPQRNRSPTKYDSTIALLRLRAL